MTELRISRGALKVLFGQQVVFLTDGPTLKRLAGLLETAGCSLVLGTKDGRLHLPGEPAAEAALQFPGVPAGLAGCLGTKALAPLYNVLQTRYHAAMASFVPGFHLVQGRFGAGAGMARFVSGCLATHGRRLAERAAHLDRQIVQLRMQGERTAGQLEVARRMIEGAGFGLDYPVLEAVPGTATVGPGGSLDTASFSQILPVDSAGLVRVDLYLAAAVRAGAQGYLRIRVCRAADRACLAERILTYSDIETGWVTLALASADILSYGDACLDLDWFGTEGHVPLAALSDMEPVKFGTAEGRTLALRAWRGIGDMFSSGSLTQMTPPFLSPVRTDIPADLLVAHLRDGKGVGLTEDASAFTIAVSAADWTQLRFANLVMPGAKAASLALTAESDVEAVLLTASPDFEPDAASMKSRRIGTSVTVLRLPVIAKAGEDIVLALRARAPSDQVAVQVERLSLDHVLAGPASRKPLPGQDHRPRIWPVRFPDVMESVLIPGGPEAVTALCKRTGITAVQFAEEAGYLQLHPTWEGPAAIGFSGLLNRQVREIRARVSNANDAAPLFRFSLALVPAGGAESPDCMTALGRAIRSSDGKGARDGMQWASLDLAGGQSGSVVLEGFGADDAERLEASDIVLMVLSIADSISFGWCRWYSLDLVTGALEAS